MQNTVIQVGSPEKTKWKNTLAPVRPKLANNLGPGGGK
jgi:hypothetical protein